MSIKHFDELKKITTSKEELAKISGLRDTVEWAVLKRWAAAYIQNLKNVSFKLKMNDREHRFAHTDYAGQAQGIKTLIEKVENAPSQLAKLEKKEDKNATK